MDYLFVYGTLLKPINNPMSKFLNKHSEFLGTGFINGKLYDVGSYPAAISSNLKTDKIFGTVLKIKNAEQTFKVLDMYEGTTEANPLYIKKTMSVYLDNQSQVTAWVYIYNRSVNHLKRILSGNYLTP